MYYKKQLFLAGCLVINFLCITTSKALYGQEAVLKRLNGSPRHHEWVKVKQGERTVESFLVYPQVKEKVPAVLVIHENRGLTDWVRGVADQIAEAGYIAIAPDLLSGMGPDGGKTSDFSDRNAARDALYELTPGQVTADLNAVSDYVSKLAACNGVLVVGGFCWGGRQTFEFATKRTDLKAAFVFYGTAPENETELQKISCPVYGFYGENDARVSSAVPAISEQMKKLGKMYKSLIYSGAGHGFMRSGEEADADDANRKARDQAWQRWLDILKKI